MVYDRQYDDETLSFEASGALKDGALVMRDRETDSWWSIMAAEAIECLLKILLFAALALHAFCLTPWESRAYSTAHTEPERAPRNLAQPQLGIGRNPPVRKGILGPGSDFSYLT